MIRLLFILLLLPSFVFSYTVVRKDGRPFKGDLVNETPEFIMLEDQIGIQVKFRKDQLDLEKTKQANAPGAKEDKDAAFAPKPEPLKERTIGKVDQEENGWTGEKISVDFKDIDIKEFFRFIAEISGMNMILDPGVKGSLTIKLVDVPWDQALDLVCRQYGLAYEIDGNVYSVK
jgi:type II secretory pathway component HofQ